MRERANERPNVRTNDSANKLHWVNSKADWINQKFQIKSQRLRNMKTDLKVGNCLWFHRFTLSVSLSLFISLELVDIVDFNQLGVYFMNFS